MTSANVTYYHVTEIATGKEVGYYSSHAMCKSHLEEDLAKHVPEENFHLMVIWPDEEEEDHVSFEGNLHDFLEDRRIMKEKVRLAYERFRSKKRSV